jgi:tetratricopeptide (TPR) repeat protein
MTYQSIGRGEDALADLDRAIELDPDNTLIRTAMALPVGREDAHQQMGRREDAALADLDRAIELGPDTPTQLEIMSRIQRAQAYQSMGRHEDALADLDRAIELDPDNLMARTARGTVYEHVGRHEDALADLDRAIELDPDDIVARSIEGMARVERGKVYQNLGRHEDALADFNRATMLDPSLEPYVSSILGPLVKVYLTEGEPERAAAIFGAVTEVAPNSADAHNNYGFCLLPIDAHRAMEEFEVANRLQPDMLLAIANEVLAFHLLGRDQEALALGNSDKAKSLSPQSGSMWNIDANHTLRLSDWNDVHEYLRTLLAHIESHG